jgi:hypothetical protein
MSWPVARYGTWMHKSQDCPRICRGRETVGGLPEKVGGIVLCDPDCQRGLSKNHPDNHLASLRVVSCWFVFRINRVLRQGGLRWHYMPGLIFIQTIAWW